MDAGDKYKLQDIQNFPREMLYWVYDVLCSIKRSIQEMCLTFVVRRKLWE